MKHYSITILTDDLSLQGYNTLVESSKKVGNKFTIDKFSASVAKFANAHMKAIGLKWTYPWQGERVDILSGLKLSAYQTRVQEKRIACFLSHYRIWKEVLDSNEPALVLEHDALFTQKLDYQYILDSQFDIVGINNPLGSTRKSSVYHNIIKETRSDIQPVPRIDEFNVPQGLAGNSAYIIKPNGAKQLIAAVDKYGAWPNDAIMCYQLINNLGVTKEFYTKVQGLPSTTTG